MPRPALSWIEFPWTVASCGVERSVKTQTPGALGDKVPFEASTLAREGE